MATMRRILAMAGFTLLMLGGTMYAQIDTAAAVGAAFDFQTGVRGLQIGEDAVHGERLRVRRRK